MFSTRILRSMLVLLICLGSLSGCASLSTESVGSGQVIVAARITDVQADERLPLFEINQDLPSDNRADADVVRWGGTITRVENLADDRTLLEIVSRPLRRNGRPIHNDTSEGRFFAYIEKFLDPEIVVPGRDVTIVGALIARQSGAIGEAQYIFPVVAARDVDYWKKQVAAEQHHFPQWNRYHRHNTDPFIDFWIRPRRPGSSRR